MKFVLGKCVLLLFWFLVVLFCFSNIVRFKVKKKDPLHDEITVV